MSRTFLSVLLALFTVLIGDGRTRDTQGERGAEDLRDRRESGAQAAPRAPDATGPADRLRGLTLRSLGPVLTTGRVGDIAVDPQNPSLWYVAAASGGLWKTVNRGNTWIPIFDDYGAYSLGCVTVDPRDPTVLWLGTGENQSQRSVGFGDGVYKSTDAGATWRRVGLERSEHIAEILIDPRDSSVVWVASQGPLWAAGGDRGLYKTIDGGQTWTRVLHVSNDTGVADLAMDPRNPDVVYAASYQRRRHTGLLVAGGPESNIYKTTDGGKTWTTLTEGLPAGDRGRIAIALSPQQPDVVYALVTAAGKDSGFYRSAAGGALWRRQSDYIVVDPQYYGELYPDPHRFDRVYAVDVRIHVTEDGGKTFAPVDWDIHVDNHAMVFDPGDPRHLLVGNDGGLYESWDAGATWRHFTNLPIPQFYRVATDNATPFYNVYGGAQDNGSLGGPSRTPNAVGIRTSDWISVGGGDGMQPRVHPQEPSVVYNQSQNGALTRLDLRTNERASIRPRLDDPEPPLRWNWDAPLIVSSHAGSRLYFAANRLFRSDDRGDTWRPVSPDLTKAIDRDTLPVMGKVWGPDAVWKNRFTTALSVISALDESPLVEGLLYVGTNDGLVQVSEDGGQTWRKVEKISGMREMATVSDLRASRMNANTVYASFHYYEYGDFRPYLFRSLDRGQTWTPITGDLPDRHIVWTIVDDHLNPNLLFAGTEFGLFASVDGGARWMPMHGGLPTVAVRDLQIQRRETDLVVGTFGRGIYVLDDYTPLRYLTADTWKLEATLFPLRKACLFSERTYVRAAWGNETTANSPFGAVFTYFVREARPTDAQPPTIVLVIKDAQGETVRTIDGTGTAGLQRVTWDLREAPRAEEGPGGQRRERPGPLVAPGSYVVTLGMRAGDTFTPLGEQTFEVERLPT